MYDEINFEEIEEGMSIHILHIGSYDEAQSFEKMGWIYSEAAFMAVLMLIKK